MSNEMKLRKHKRKKLFFSLLFFILWTNFLLLYDFGMFFKPQKSENKNNEKFLSFFFSFYMLLFENQLLVCLVWLDAGCWMF